MAVEISCTEETMQRVYDVVVQLNEVRSLKNMPYALVAQEAHISDTMARLALAGLIEAGRIERLRVNPDKKNVARYYYVVKRAE